MMKTRSFLVKSCSFFIFIGAVVFVPCVSQAKTDEDQNQIILLNDAASAVEDSNPELSKELAKFADEKEKEWEYKSANKNALPTPVTVKNFPQLKYQIKLLKEAAITIKPTYPIIAKSLYKMAHDLNRIIENEE